MPTLAFVGVAHIHVPGFVRAIQARSAFKVKSVWDPSVARSTYWAAQSGANVASDFASIYADPSIDAVIVCSETHLHEQLVLPAVAARKSIFVEKPLGFSATDATVMASAIEQSGVVFQTGYFRRGEAVHLFLKEQIDKKTFGKITRVRASNCHAGSLGGWFDSRPADPANDWRWMADPAIAGCGAFGDLGTHMLDILIWLMGDVSAVTATLNPGTGRYGDCDELGEGLLRFKNGAVGTLAAAWTDLADPVSLMISGTEAYAYVLNQQLYFVCKGVEGADGKAPWTKLPENRPGGFEAFLDALEHTWQPNLVTAAEAAYRSYVMGAMYEAAKNNRWIDIK